MNDQEQTQIFSEWMECHRGLMFKVIRAFAFSASDQEDLFQEIATQVWRSIPTFQGDSSVATWVYRVALYSAVGWSRRERRHRQHQQPLDAAETPINHLKEDASTQEHGNRLDWLYRQIKQMNEIDRSLTLLLLEGVSYQEIASTIGISVNNVAVRLHRIKNRLTKLSEEEFRYEL